MFNYLAIQETLFYLIILFLPTQFGRHFWPSFSYVLGFRVDYLSPTLYVTDILIFALFLIWIFTSLSIQKIKFTIYHLPFTIFLVFLLIGIVSSTSPLAGFYGLIKLLEFCFFGFYIAGFMRKKENIQKVLLLLAIGVLLESFLAITQYLHQGSLNGIFYFFGERNFTTQTPGIANASIDGQLLLRPYGTFPHPNVLAGYLVIAMTVIIYHLPFTIYHFKKYFFTFSLFFGSIALFLTMSRMAIIVWILIFIVGSFRFLKIKNHKSSIINRQSVIGLLVVLVCIGSIALFSPLDFRFTGISLSDESIVIRKELAKTALTMVQSNPVFGVGINNFLPNLPQFQKPLAQSLFSYIQPVHNIFLLIAAQAGIVGLSAFLWGIGITYKRFTIYDLRFMILSGVLFLGLFDHYLLTLQQGQLLFAFVFGWCWTRPISR